MSYIKIIKQVGILSTLFTLPFSYVSAQNATYINNILDQFRIVINLLIPLLVAIALLFFIWGLVLFIAQAGNEQVREEGKQKMIWGIVSLFVIVSVWGLVSLLQDMAGVNGDASGLNKPQTTYTP